MDDFIEMIPIFIITCDRMEVLKRSILSYYDSIETPFEIVICDQGSTFKPMVAYLKELQADGIRIYRWKDNNDGETTNFRRDDKKIGEDIKDYFITHPESNYVVTDPDILLDNVNGDILEAYAYVLKKILQVTIVGPMLRIDDIPDYYPKKIKLTTSSWHVNFHAREVHSIDYEGTQIRYVFAPIHTTFGMFRAGAKWHGNRAIRTFAPYSAKHLDWYLDPDNLTEDQKYYMKHASTNAHWSKGWPK